MSPEDSLALRQQKFNRAFHFVITSEGGTNHDPVDRGGLTKWGISEKQYPNIDIENLTLSTAKHLYLNDYWLKNQCDKMGSDLGVVVFDSSVNCGQPSGGKWIQLACNKLGSNLVVDGIVGPRTMFEVYRYSSTKLQSMVVAERLRRYVWMLNKYPEQKKYIKGWIDRVANLLDFAMISDPSMFEK